MTKRLKKPMNRSQIRGVIFDLDGTLIDSYQAIFLSFYHAFTQLGLAPLSYDQVPKVVGQGLNQTFRDLLGEERVLQAVSFFREKYEEVYRSYTHLLPDVREVLEVLHGRGIQLAVATNKFGHFSRAILEHLGIEAFFTVIVGDGDTSQNKPHPAMLRLAMEKMETEKENTVLVGDSLVDIQAAKNAGIRVYVVPTGNTEREELMKAQPTAVLERLPDLLAYI